MRPLNASIAALAASITGHACDTQAQPLADVVVSASRSEQRSFDAPAAVQGVNARTLSEAGAQVNLSEAINRVPGVTALNRQNYAQDLQLSIRGFGARSTFGIRGVRLIVDGIPATMPDGQGQASTISLSSAERIEVLRGPIAQLYGNAAGGVVQVFTRDGPAIPFAQAMFSAGSYGSSRTDLQAGGQSGKVNWVADLSDFATNGYRDHSEAVRRQFNTKWRFDLSDDTRLTVVANAFDQPRALDPLGLTRAQFEANPRQSPAIAFTQDAQKVVSQQQVGAVLDHRIDTNNKVSARLYAGQRDLSNKLSVPLAAQSAVTSAGGIVDLDRNYAGFGLQYSNRIASRYGLFETVVGVDIDQMKDRRRGYLNSAGVQGALKRDENNLATSTGLYAQSIWRISPEWSATAGLRSTSVNFKVEDFFVATGNPDDSGSVKYTATNPVVGITRHFGDTVNVFLNWGRGFETPTFTEIAYKPGASGMNLGLNASRSRHLELGAKAKLGPNHRLDASIYTIGTSDELTVDTNNGGRTTYRNAGRTDRQGFELAYSGRLTETVGTYLALTALRAQFTDGFAGGTGNVAAGNRIAGVPDRYVYGELAWRPAIRGPFAGLHTAIEMVHAGKLWVNDTNTDAASGYTIFNLRAGLQQQVGNWRISEFVRLDNATNRSYVGSVIVNDTNLRYFEPSPGRTWLAGVMVRYDFR